MTIAVVRRVDVAPHRPATTEGALFHGYSRAGQPSSPLPEVTAECACGGTIRALDRESDIAEAVHIHNESTVHERWAMAEGLR